MTRQEIDVLAGQVVRETADLREQVLLCVSGRRPANPADVAVLALNLERLATVVQGLNDRLSSVEARQ